MVKDAQGCQEGEKERAGEGKGEHKGLSSKVVQYIYTCSPLHRTDKS